MIVTIIRQNLKIPNYHLVLIITGGLGSYLPCARDDFDHLFVYQFNLLVCLNWLAHIFHLAQFAVHHFQNLLSAILKIISLCIGSIFWVA